jgi:hypothetical protein
MREQEAGHRVGDDDQAGCPDIEAGTVRDRLLDAQRDRDDVGQQQDPHAERDRNRHFLDDQVDHVDVRK